MKSVFKERGPGFYLAFWAACIAIVGAISYLCVYMTTSDKVTGEIDRVFCWQVLAAFLAGAAVSLLGELLRFDSAPLAAAVFYGVGLSWHLVQAAYPIADVFTKIKFFGGDPVLAIVFSAVFGAVGVLHIIAAFCGHGANKE